MSWRSNMPVVYEDDDDAIVTDALADLERTGVFAALAGNNATATGPSVMPMAVATSPAESAMAAASSSSHYPYHAVSLADQSTSVSGSNEPHTLPPGSPVPPSFFDDWMVDVSQLPGELPSTGGAPVSPPNAFATNLDFQQTGTSNMAMGMPNTVHVPAAYMQPESGAAQPAVDTRPAGLRAYDIEQQERLRQERQERERQERERQERKRRASEAMPEEEEVGDSGNVSYEVAASIAQQGALVFKAKAKAKAKPKPKPKPPAGQQQPASSSSSKPPPPQPLAKSKAKAKAKAKPNPKPAPAPAPAPAQAEEEDSDSDSDDRAAVAKPQPLLGPLPRLAMDHALDDMLTRHDGMPLVFACYSNVAMRGFSSHFSDMFDALNRKYKQFIVNRERPLTVLLRYIMMAESEPLSLLPYMFDEYMVNARVTLVPVVALCNRIANSLSVVQRSTLIVGSEKTIGDARAAMENDLARHRDRVNGVYAYLVDQCVSTSRFLFDVTYDPVLHRLVIQNRCFYQTQNGEVRQWHEMRIMEDDARFVAFEARLHDALGAAAALIEARYVRRIAQGMAAAVTMLYDDSDARGQRYAHSAAPKLNIPQADALTVLRLGARVGQVDPARVAARCFESIVNDTTKAFADRNLLNKNAAATPHEYIEWLAQLAAANAANEIAVVDVLRTMRHYYALTRRADAPRMLGEEPVLDANVWHLIAGTDNEQAIRSALANVLQCRLLGRDLTPLTLDMWDTMKVMLGKKRKGETETTSERANFTRKLPGEQGGRKQFADALVDIVLYHDDPNVEPLREALRQDLTPSDDKKAEPRRLALPGITRTDDMRKDTDKRVFSNLAKALQEALRASAAAAPTPPPASGGGGNDDDGGDGAAAMPAQPQPDINEIAERQQAAAGLAMQEDQRQAEALQAFSPRPPAGDLDLGGGGGGDIDLDEDDNYGGAANVDEFYEELARRPLLPRPLEPAPSHAAPPSIDWTDVEPAVAPSLYNTTDPSDVRYALRTEITQATLANWERVLMVESETRMATRVFDTLTAMRTTLPMTRSALQQQALASVITDVLRRVYFHGQHTDVIPPKLLYGQVGPGTPFGDVEGAGKEAFKQLGARVSAERPSLSIANPTSNGVESPLWVLRGQEALAIVGAALRGGTPEYDITRHDFYFQATLQVDSAYAMHHFLDRDNRRLLYHCARVLANDTASLRDMATHIVQSFGPDIVKYGGAAMIGLEPSAPIDTVAVAMYLIASMKQLIAIYNDELTTSNWYTLTRTLLLRRSTGYNEPLSLVAANDTTRLEIVTRVRVCLVQMLHLVFYIVDALLPAMADDVMVNAMLVRRGVMPTPSLLVAPSSTHEMMSSRPPVSPSVPSTPQSPSPPATPQPRGLMASVTTAMAKQSRRSSYVGSLLDNRGGANSNSDSERERIAERQLSMLLTRPVYWLQGRAVPAQTFVDWYRSTHALTLITAATATASVPTRIDVPRVVAELWRHGSLPRYNAMAHGTWTIVQRDSGEATDMVLMFSLLPDSQDQGLGGRYGETLQRAVVVALYDQADTNEPTLYNLKLVRSATVAVGTSVPSRQTWVYTLQPSTNAPHALARELPLVRVGGYDSLMLWTPSHGRSMVQSHVLFARQYGHYAALSYYVYNGTGDRLVGDNVEALHARRHVTLHSLDLALHASLPMVHLRARVVAHEFASITSVEVMRTHALERLGVGHLTLDMFNASAPQRVVRMDVGQGTAELALTGLRVPKGTAAGDDDDDDNGGGVYYAVRLIHFDGQIDALLHLIVEVVDTQNRVQGHRRELLHIATIESNGQQRSVAVPVSSEVVPVISRHVA